MGFFWQNGAVLVGKRQKRLVASVSRSPFGLTIAPVLMPKADNVAVRDKSVGYALSPVHAKDHA